MAKVIMIQGTMSNVGKSLLTTGLVRIFMQDGFKTAPFKSQNMTSNSFVTKEGLEMGKAQAIQAEAAGIIPDVRMNPIILKPGNNYKSKVILNGKEFGNVSGNKFTSYKQQFMPEIKKAYDSLAEEYDIIVIEGAGSPTEMNLKKNDIVNMGLAKMVQAPVLLLGDIERGGVFAQIVGTLVLFTEEEKKMVKGSIINKFHGKKEYFESGVSILEEKSSVPVIGVVPFVDVDIEEEDSLFQNPIKDKQNITDIEGYNGKQYDILAASLREHLNIKKIYEILEDGV